ncbi:MAG: hypothetical protein HY326_14475, partial [Chloroflexi bacterium]|nr:hypothetical protein [Chloroflexota bacterium]
MKSLPILNGKKLISLVGLVLIVGFLVVAPAWAATGRSGGDVVIGTDEVIDDDLYVSGQTVTINGTVKGDVIAMGGTIMINGTVQGDVIAVGQTIVINGPVGQHARIAGQVLVLGANARVTDAVTAAGFSLEMQSGSQAQKDLIYVGYQGLVAGTIGRDLKGSMAALELSGDVNRDVNVEVGGGGESSAYTQFMPQATMAIPAVQPG